MLEQGDEMIADIICDLSFGDSGKGKVTHHLLSQNEYTHCIRYNGGCNAGHTIYHEGRKFVTHHIPAGVFYGVRSVIGSGCVVNKTQFFSEIKMLEEGGINCDGLIKIAENAHVITDSHLEEDGSDERIGTTRTGNGPAYRDKYARVGVRVEDDPDLSEYAVDMFRELHMKKNTVALFEGAQGFGLDVDWGDYPYVTSSHCTTAGAMLNGIPPKSVRDVWGVAKCYETYVGAKQFQPSNEIFNKIREVGDEYGATTGRPRQCNWLSIVDLKRAVIVNGVNNLVINKMDVLRELDKWEVRRPNVFFTQENVFKSFIERSFDDSVKIHFSDNPYTI